MSRRRIEIPPLTERNHHFRKMSQQSGNELNYTLSARINSMIELDEQLSQKFRILSQSQVTSKDLGGITQSLQEMVGTLQKVSHQEILFNQLKRDNHKLQQEVMQLKQSNDKLQQHFVRISKENEMLVDKLKSMENEYGSLNKKYGQEHKQNEDVTRKLKRSEQRVQVILDSNILVQRDQLKLTLLETLQENEKYKKSTLQKQKDIQKQVQITYQINDEQQHIELEDQQTQQPIQCEQEFIDSDKMVITFTNIPINFTYRYVFLNAEYKQFIQFIQDYSQDEFVHHLNQLTVEQRKQQLGWLYSYMTNYSEFCIAHNRLFVKMAELMTIHSLDQLTIFVSGLASFFKVAQVTLWLREYSTGFLTTQLCGEKKKIMGNRGAFKDCMDHRVAVNKLTINKHLMYQTDCGEDHYQDSTYLFPITNDEAYSAGIIEFHHPTSQNQYSDLQYFASIVGHFIKIQVDLIEEQTSQAKMLQQKDILVSEFLKLMACNDKFTFCEAVKCMQVKILNMSTCEIAFVEEGRIWKFGKGIQSAEECAGVCGQVAKHQQPAFFNSIGKELHYNAIVDLYSISPVYVYPIVHNKTTQAVVSVSLTNKQIQRHRYRDPLNSLNQKSNEARLFCETVATAYLAKFV